MVINCSFQAPESYWCVCIDVVIVFGVVVVIIIANFVVVAQ